MLCPLVFSRWGILTWKKPLIALLVTPHGLYRLTLSKPAESAKHAFRHLQDPGMIYKYVMSFICDYIATLQSDKTLAYKPSSLDADEH